jgi:hypothetical protein
MLREGGSQGGACGVALPCAMVMRIVLGSVALRVDVTCNFVLDVAVPTLECCSGANMALNTSASVNPHRMLSATSREALRDDASRSTDRGSGAVSREKEEYLCCGEGSDVGRTASCEASRVSTVFERSILAEVSTPQRTGDCEAVDEAEGADGVKDAGVIFVAELCNDTVHVGVGVWTDCEVLTVGACVLSAVALWE